jgi:hypothetical protein
MKMNVVIIRHARGVSVVLELPHRWVVTTACKAGPCLDAIGSVFHLFSLIPLQFLSSFRHVPFIFTHSSGH